MKILLLFIMSTLLCAAPKKKAPVVTNDDDFVPLKKKTEKKVEVPAPEVQPAPVPVPQVKATPSPVTTPEVKQAAPVPTPEKKPEATTVQEKPAPLPAPVPSTAPIPSSSEISEVLISKTYLQFTDIDTVPTDIVQWDDRSGKSLYIPKSGDPYILLMGRIKQGYSLSIDNVPVNVKGGEFEHKFVLPSDATTFNFQLKKPAGAVSTYRRNFVWLKDPGSLRVRVKDTSGVVEKSLGLKNSVSVAAAIQLTTNDELASQIDSIEHKKQNLIFKITLPTTKEQIESYTLLIRTAKRDTLTEFRKNGSPPPSLFWNDFMPDVIPPGKYTYRISIFTKTEAFDSPETKFEVTEGKVKVSTRRTLVMEPREEIGYLTYKNNNSFNTSSLYVGSELPFLYSERFIFQPGGMLALPTTDPDNAYYSARALVGMRFNGQGNKLLLLKVPYEMQFDLLLGLSRFSLSRRSPVTDFNHLTLSLQPELLLNGEQYVTPLIEYSTSASFDSMRFSFGMMYEFYVKAWSLKWGMGIALDSLFQDPNAAAKYSLFRALTSFQFQL